MECTLVLQPLEVLAEIMFWLSLYRFYGVKRSFLLSLGKIKRLKSYTIITTRKKLLVT